MKTNELLRRYVDDRSEPAFEELVKHHIDLVYSSALRQVNGDVPAAQDVTQAVFTELARHAPRLTQHTWLPGWLYTSTRYLAAKARRAEQCRRSHEQEAHEMNQLLRSTGPDTTWQELRPMLDDAMHDLSSTDREAVLMRYFERLPLAEIGARLGLKENAARMRVDRAIERLRAALTKRGVTSTVGALAATLTAQAVGTAPAGLAAKASATSLAAAAATGGLTWTLLKLAGLAGGRALIGGSAALIAAGALVVPQLLTKTTPDDATPKAPQSEVASATSPAPIPSVVFTPSTSSTPAMTYDSNEFILHIVSEKTGRAIGRPRINFAIREKASDDYSTVQPTQMTGSAQGVCEIPVWRNTALGLVVHTDMDGFADTTAVWVHYGNATIPGEFTLRLKRAAAIGGLVNDQDGKPVAGAMVQFKVLRGLSPEELEDELEDRNPRIYVCGFPVTETTVTDMEGHWRINRFAPEVITNTFGQVTHPDYPEDSPVRFAREGLEAEQQLVACDYVFTLNRGMVVSGMVVDSEERPVPNAQVVVNQRTRSRNGVSGENGLFEVAGCKPEASQIWTKANGLAQAAMLVNLTNGQAPLRIVLMPGKILRLRFIDQQTGAPFSNSEVTLHSRAREFFPQLPFIGARLTLFNGKTDADGWMVWADAPEVGMVPEINAPDYIQPTDVSVKADGMDYVIGLQKAPPIGTVMYDWATPVWHTSLQAPSGQE